MLNQVTVVGNVGRVSEVKTWNDGNRSQEFSIAHTDKWTSNGEKKEKTTWFNVPLTDKQIDGIGKYIEKGKVMIVTGSIEASAYLDTKTQQPVAKLIIRNARINFGGGSSSNSDGSQAESNGHAAPAQDAPDKDEIEF